VQQGEIHHTSGNNIGGSKDGAEEEEEEDDDEAKVGAMEFLASIAPGDNKKPP
jgi:hypothetical protein